MSYMLRTLDIFICDSQKSPGSKLNERSLLSTQILKVTVRMLKVILSFTRAHVNSVIGHYKHVTGSNHGHPTKTRVRVVQLSLLHRRLDPDRWQLVVVIVPSTRIMLWVVDIHMQTIAVASSRVNQALGVIRRAITAVPGQPTKALGVSGPPLLYTSEIAFASGSVGIEGATLG